jgi:hypothetical protein
MTTGMKTTQQTSMNDQKVRIFTVTGEKWRAPSGHDFQIDFLNKSIKSKHARI